MVRAALLLVATQALQALHAELDSLASLLRHLSGPSQTSKDNTDAPIGLAMALTRAHALARALGSEELFGELLRQWMQPADASSDSTRPCIQGSRPRAARWFLDINRFDQQSSINADGEVSTLHAQVRSG